MNESYYPTDDGQYISAANKKFIEDNEREGIAAARLAVTASKRTGDILPRYIYETAGVAEWRIPKQAGDKLIERPERWWRR